jgi:S-adenosylmethionine decarboxylase proenzyme
MKNSSAKGVHYLIDLYGCDELQINDKKNLKEILFSSVEGTKAVILNHYFYQFSPKGVTGFLLLSASHISIHTWPEKNHATIDVFTCIEKEETKKIVKKILEMIEYKKKNISFCKRGFLLNKEEGFK